MLAAEALAVDMLGEFAGIKLVNLLGHSQTLGRTDCNATSGYEQERLTKNPYAYCISSSGRKGTNC